MVVVSFKLAELDEFRGVYYVYFMADALSKLDSSLRSGRLQLHAKPTTAAAARAAAAAPTKNACCN